MDLDMFSFVSYGRPQESAVRVLSSYIELKPTFIRDRHNQGSASS